MGDMYREWVLSEAEEYNGLSDSQEFNNPEVPVERTR
jgi:hypothetical protein